MKSKLAAACSLVALWLAWRGTSVSVVATLAFAGFACTQVALVGHRSLSPLFSAEGLIAAAAPLPADARVYAVDVYDHTLPWYLRRTVTMVGYKDELDKAIEWERARFVPDFAAFAKEWKARPAAYAVVGTSDYPRLARELPMQELARDPRYVLVRKP